MSNPIRDRRDHWRKSLQGTAVHYGVLLGLCKDADTQITDFRPISSQKPIADYCVKLIDRCCELESLIPAITATAQLKIEQDAYGELWHWMLPFKQRDFNKPLYSE